MIEAQGGLGDRGAIVLGRAGWHPGVIGIVASRLVETYHRPTIVVALGDEIGQGSARSIAGFNLYEAIAACSDGLIALRRPRRRGRAEAPDAAAFASLRRAVRPPLPRRSLTAEQLQKVLHDRRRGPARHAHAPRRRGDRGAGAARDRQPPAPARGQPRPARRRAAGRRRAEEPPPAPVRQGEAALKAIGWNMAERGKALTAGHGLFARLSPVDQRVERPPRGPARGQGLPARRGERTWPMPQHPPDSGASAAGIASRQVRGAGDPRPAGARRPRPGPPRAVSSPRRARATPPRTGPSRSASTRRSASRSSSP